MRQWTNHHWSAPSHYLNQCWDIVKWSFRNKLQWNLQRKSYIPIKKTPLIVRFMGPTWGPSGADRTQVAPCWPHELCHQEHLKISVKWRPFCLGLNVLTDISVMQLQMSWYLQDHAGTRHMTSQHLCFFIPYFWVNTDLNSTCTSCSEFEFIYTVIYTVYNTNNKLISLYI